MRKLICVLTLISSLQGPALAEETIESRNGPCKQVLEACKKYISEKSTSENKKSLYKDCMQPLLNDKTTLPDGLVINPEQVEACKKKKAQLKNSDN